MQNVSHKGLCNRVLKVEQTRRTRVGFKFDVKSKGRPKKCKQRTLLLQKHHGYQGGLIKEKQRSYQDLDAEKR